MVRRDPHDVLGVAPERARRRSRPPGGGWPASTIPTLPATAAERAAATRRMAEINAAYADLRRRRRAPGAPAAVGEPAHPAADRAPRAGRSRARARPDRHRPRRRGRSPLASTPATCCDRGTPRPRRAGDGYRHHPRGQRPPQARPGRRGAAARVGSDRSPGARCGRGAPPPAAARRWTRAASTTVVVRQVPRPDARARSRTSSLPTWPGSPGRSPATPTCSTRRGWWPRRRPRPAGRGRRGRHGGGDRALRVAARGRPRGRSRGPGHAAGRPAPGAPPGSIHVPGPGGKMPAGR